MVQDKGFKEFICWKCKIILFLYNCKIKVVIKCPECKITNRASVSEKEAPKV